MLSWDSLTNHDKCLLGTCILTVIANIFLVIGTLTPAWQVAEDTDVNRYVQSGLWLYCPGAAQCWYIFSDDLINYYEKVDVCRFLLIGDCRKKLLRTPYFFGWHYAVLILNIIAIGITSAAIVVAALPTLRRNRPRVAAILFDVLLFTSILILSISLMVFVVNAEMLESKYLIGVKNTFEKYYGYSFYLACLALLLLVFASLGAVLVTTFAFRNSPTMDRDCTSPSQAPCFAERPMLPFDVHRDDRYVPSPSQTSEFQQQTRHFYSY
uniref:Clc-like protein 2 n=1 Tax=Haemonchus contortus TaxID=6289 RepID=A0A7I4YEW3_HAECO